MKLITADVHSDVSTVGRFAGPKNNLYMQQELSIPTTIEHFKNVILNTGNNVIVVIEEGSMSGWLKRNLETYTKRFVVSEPKHNDLIAKNPNKDESEDIQGLADLFVMGKIKEVYHTDSLKRQKFKDLVLYYADIASQVSSAKSKLKAHYLYCGRHMKGARIYNPENRQENIQMISSQTDPVIIENLFDLLERKVQIKKSLDKRIAKKGREYPVISRFRDIPGVGNITAATFFAIVDTPWRFKTVKKLWKYNGLAVGRQTSNGRWLSREGLLPEGNRLLKNRMITAAKNAVRTTSDNPFKRLLRRKISQEKTRAAAVNTVARKLVSVMWGMWKTDSYYDPAKVG